MTESSNMIKSVLLWLTFVSIGIGFKAPYFFREGRFPPIVVNIEDTVSNKIGQVGVPWLSTNDVPSIDFPFVEYHGWNQSKHLFLNNSTFSLREPKSRALVMWWKSALYSTFVPSGDISSQYFSYVMWRTVQRMISSTNNVFSTQALLLALGFKRSRVGIAAITSWVLKDAFGKLARVAWASGFGRKFDSNAKKWRFKAAILYALGNSLEVSTLLFPSYFLVAAAIGNALKQVAMLTASATRNSIYKSFSGHSDNIGDITAKGEAQIAVIDILGMLAGVSISRFVESSKLKIISIFAVLTTIDLFCVYKEIQSVVFKTLNFNRCCEVLPYILQNKTDTTPSDEYSPISVARRERLLVASTVDESLVKVFSSLSPAGLRQFLNLQQNNSIPIQDKFIVLFSLVPVTSLWEKLAVQWKIRRNAWLGTIHDQSNREIPVVLSSEVLLHRRATSMDLFRAIVITWRGALWFRNIDNRKHFEVMDWNSNCENELNNIAQSLRVTSYNYEQAHRSEIFQFLEENGWETKQFSLGSMRLRVDF